MKILYVVTGLANGGAERVVCDLANEMFVRGHEVKIAYLTGEVLTQPDYKEIELIKVNLNDLKTLLPAYLKLSKIIKKFRPDVVHSHMVHANILMRLVRITTPIDKLISTAHNSNEGGALRMISYRVTHRLADVSTNVSQEATQAFEDMGAVPKDGMQTVYNGISLKKFRYISGARARLEEELGFTESYRVILAVGRFNEQKDYPNLLKAISLLKEETTYPFKVIIAGDGELRDTIENKVNNLGLKDEVLLLGRRTNIPELMSAADLFVLPSKYEGFGLVVAEAMACRCLVVATDSGGVAEVLNNPEFLVPPSDALALKTKIKYALELNSKDKDKIVDVNFKHVRDSFSLENAIQKWIALYHE
ncbi:glycosyltransferase [Psychrobacter jeotgali]|uniref:glycosyltransferase n=1 Tax=Psychrobacter jeotgali TaxID=179010 RepID=UPI00191A9D0F|nr:glycosyltransferase [Psychrobacter jeotgali]